MILENYYEEDKEDGDESEFVIESVNSDITISASQVLLTDTPSLIQVPF